MRIVVPGYFMGPANRVRLPFEGSNIQVPVKDVSMGLCAAVGHVHGMPLQPLETGVLPSLSIPPGRWRVSIAPALPGVSLAAREVAPPSATFGDTLTNPTKTDQLYDIAARNAGPKETLLQEIVLERVGE